MVLVATQVKRRRGTEAENDAFTGAEGEITVDLTNNELRVHDGSTVGGHKVVGDTRFNNAISDLQAKLPADVINASPFIVAGTSSHKHIKFFAGTVLQLDSSHILNITADTEYNVVSYLDTGSALSNGKDYCIYLVPDGDGVKIAVSLNASAPSGYSSYRKIGGFHTLCVNVGTITGHTLSGYVSTDILPASIWCLNHRPLCNPAGMVYEPVNDVWVDIYNMNTSGGSAYGATRAHTLQHFQFVELARANGKTLLTDNEFYCASKGSNQKTAVQGSAQPNPDTTGGRNDTGGRRMISNIGCEEMCGLQWQHLDPTYSAGGSGWNGQNGDEGSFYGSCMVLRAGGLWSESSYCGSRCRAANSSLSRSNVDSGARGRCPALHTVN